MGVDFYPCSNCGETFPDCGVYHICDEEHMLCEYCMRNVPEAKETDVNGWFNSKHCPTCAKGGTASQRLRKIHELLDFETDEDGEYRYSSNDSVVNIHQVISQIRNISRPKN